MLCIDPADSTIKYRWFILECVRTRNGQYRISLKRDAIADNLEDILNSTCFIEKGYVDKEDSGKVYLARERLTCCQYDSRIIKIPLLNMEDIKEDTSLALRAHRHRDHTGMLLRGHARVRKGADRGCKARSVFCQGAACRGPVYARAHGEAGGHAARLCEHYRRHGLIRQVAYLSGELVQTSPGIHLCKPIHWRNNRT